MYRKLNIRSLSDKLLRSINNFAIDFTIGSGNWFRNWIGKSGKECNILLFCRQTSWSTKRSICVDINGIRCTCSTFWYTSSYDYNVMSFSNITVNFPNLWNSHILPIKVIFLRIVGKLKLTYRLTMVGNNRFCQVVNF